jgi:hypothetical protein
MTQVELREELSGGEELPSPGVPVWVQCEGYRCLAARDENGAWLSYPGRKPIEKVRRLLPFPV